MSKDKRVLPPTYFFAAVAVMIGLHFWLPVADVVAFPGRYPGAGLAALGIGTVVWLALGFDRAGTSIKPFEESTFLFTTGLYRFSRNPMYLGMVVTLIGVWVLLGSLTPMVVLPFFVWVIQRRFIRIEERDLEETFGDSYRQYKQRVRCWI